MLKFNHFAGISALLSLLVAGCGSDGNNNPASGTSEFNPDLDGPVNTGEPGGDTTLIAGLWDGTTSGADGNDLVYWNLAANGVLTRYDYQQDSGAGASGENCYIVGDTITVTPEGANDYSIHDVAVTAVVTDESLVVTFLESDKNDLDKNGDVDETPVLTWSGLTSPVLEDLNSCDGQITVNSDPQNRELPQTFFNGRFDGQDKVGDGITISRPSEASLHIRGLWGQAQLYYQVDIVVNQPINGTYQLDDNVAIGGISEIVGGDAVGASYSASGNASDTVTFAWDQDTNRIVGKFAFTAVGGDANFAVDGEFNTSVSESGDWDCNFGDEFISRCWFIE